MKVKINKGDTVEIIAGNDKGHRGEVQRVIRKKNTDGTYNPDKVYVIVAGANMVIKHQRPTGRVGTQTGRIELEAPIHISNVMLVGSNGKAARRVRSRQGRQQGARRPQDRRPAVQAEEIAAIECLTFRRTDRRLRARSKDYERTKCYPAGAPAEDTVQ